MEKKILIFTFATLQDSFVAEFLKLKFIIYSFAKNHVFWIK